MAKFCFNCGISVQEGTKFCPSCGTQLITQEAAPAVIPQLQPVPARCAHCGQPLDADSAFCEFCGNPVSGANAPAVARTSFSSATSATAAPPPKKKNPAIAAAVSIAVIVLGIGGFFLWKSRQKPTPPDEKEKVTTVFSRQTDISTKPTTMTETTAVSAHFQLPEGAVLNTGASAANIVGEWAGKFRFTVMSGMENMDGAPDNILEIEQQALETPVDFQLELEKDGGWSYNIDFMRGMAMRDRDFRTPDPNNPDIMRTPLYKDPTNGHITMQTPDLSEDGMTGSAKFDIAVCCDAEGALLAGTLDIIINMNGTEVHIAGTFTVRPEELTGISTEETQAPPKETEITTTITEPAVITEPPVVTQPAVIDGSSRPDFSDFGWFEDYTDAPAGVKWLDFPDYLGDWKVQFFYPVAMTYQLVNINIDPSQNGIAVRIDWYMVHYNGEPPYSEEDIADTVLEGYQWGNGIYAQGLVTLDLAEFYEKDGHQYGTGTMTLPNGTTAKVAMMR